MTLPGALGAIEPSPEVRATLAERAAHLAADPSGVLVPVSTQSLPTWCMDGRPCSSSGLAGRSAPSPYPAGRAPAHPGPVDRIDHGGPHVRAPGATVLVWVADLLVTRAFSPLGPGVAPPGPPKPMEASAPASRQASNGRAEGDELRDLSPTWLSLMCAHLREHGHRVSGHTGPTSALTDCGCAALDNLATELGLVAQSPEHLAQVARSWGLDVGDLPDNLARSCAHLTTTLPGGAGISGVLAGYAQGPLPHLGPHHREVALVVNTRPGTTVDDAAAVRALLGDLQGVEDEGGAPAQVFVLDAWAFDTVAQVLVEAARERGAPPGDESALARHLVSVMAVFSVAVGMTLCGPGMPVLVLR
ncbi:hypothetical protein I6B53_09690 [Schaalia sp. 19OD2882]|uniref:hypothetical protein n=1 Tax=Schaalia sp. 19OD2882 TaxID=2794089 RepID=UPI001C1EB774|nr:hypothetical protein [Schaalia sp. 19OD2882]QWW19352.1 hypothetical protein I6B53_09690 [Schaalia sp. 19OD2882]